MLMEFIVPSMRIVALIELINSSALEIILLDLVELEEDWFVTVLHQQIHKTHTKAWHDKHIK
jgi:hypothetical protein